MKTIKEKIQQSGLKATPQRLAVYQAMQQLGHASVDMLTESLSSTFPTLTVATVYNVLESFVEAGLLVRRYSCNNKMYFDVNTYSHAHFYDPQTNRHLDYEDNGLVEVVTDYINKKGVNNFKLESVDIQLIGTIS